MFALIFTIFATTIIVPAAGALSTLWYGLVTGNAHTVPILSWWLGSALSALVTTSLLIRWVKRPFTPRTIARYVEILVSLIVLFGSSAFLFGTATTTLFGISLAYFQIAALFWLAFRGGVRFTTVGLFGMTAISLIGALYGTHAPTTPPRTLAQLISTTEIYDLLLAFFFFIIVSLEEQRKNALAALGEHAHKLEEALGRIRGEDEAKNEFIALLGHELRNPLASLLSSVELLTLADPPKEEREQTLEMMDRRIRSMAHILDDILDISRITQRKFVLNKETVSMTRVARHAIAAVQPLMQKQRHAFTAALPPEDEEWVVEADSTRLEQVLINLLHNAAKYTQPGGRIDFTYRYENGEMVATVKDTGIGIPSGMLRRIFEPFVQIHSKAARAGGVGIGLSLSRSLIDLHGGTIEAKSEGEGTGSEFTVRLPATLLTKSALQPASEGTRSSSVRTIETPERSGLKVLVVDDNEDAAQSLGRLLELRGHRVALAYDGAGALSGATLDEPQVIILDIGLPDMDGYAVARGLRERRVGSMLIALSGYGQEEDKLKAAAAGFDFHLTKPIGLADLEPLLMQAVPAR